MIVRIDMLFYDSLHGFQLHLPFRGSSRCWCVTFRSPNHHSPHSDECPTKCAAFVASVSFYCHVAACHAAGEAYSKTVAVAVVFAAASGGAVVV